MKPIGENVPFERIRRITGYLVGTTAKFNNAKKAEEKDRVKHGVEQGGKMKGGEAVALSIQQENVKADSQGQL